MRLFLAVWPDAATASVLESLPRPSCPGVRWTDSAHWHITLRFLGDASDADECLSAMDGLVMPPAPLVLLGPRTFLLNPTVLVLPATGLDALAAAVRALPVGVSPGAWDPADPRPFRGHLTLARGRRPGDLAGAAPAGRALEAGFIPAQVALVSSEREPQGGPNRYELVGAWPLPRP